MNESRDEPDPKACAKHNPQGQVPSKTHKGHQEKQNARQNPPKRPLTVFGHQVEIRRVIHIQPNKKNGPRQRHYRDKPGQRRQLVFIHYPGTQGQNTQAEQYLDHESHTERSLVIGAHTAKTGTRNSIFKAAQPPKARLLFNEPDTQPPPQHK